MDERGLTAFLQELYAAASGPGDWAAVAAGAASLMNASSCSLQMRDQSHGGIDIAAATPNFQPEALEVYRDHYYQHDEWTKRAAKAGLGQVFLGHEVMDDTSLVRSDFYDYLRLIDVHHVVGTTWLVEPGVIGAIGVHRDWKAEAFDLADKNGIKTLLPHLQRAMQIRRRLAAARMERDAALEGLERLDLATLVVRESGLISFANRRALGLISQGDGLVACNGRLQGHSRGMEALLHLITEACRTAAARGVHPGGAVAIARPTKRPLMALVAPFGSSEPAALVFIRDAEAGSPIASSALRSLYGLTSAEAMLATKLADGASIDMIADERQTSLNTLRTQLKSVMAKTGTSRQGELVALILRSVATLAR